MPAFSRRLAQLAGISLEGEEPPRFEDLAQRVCCLAANTLLERAHGKPREYDPNAEPRNARVFSSASLVAGSLYSIQKPL